MAAISVFAVAVYFEIVAYFGLVVLVEGVFVSEFVLGVSEGTLT